MKSYGKKENIKSIRFVDDGVGFDPSALGVADGKKHLGLISMRERAEILGGTLDVYTAPDMGTTIQVTIPVGDM